VIKKKEMNILVLGYGSIGQRHVHNLLNHTGHRVLVRDVFMDKVPDHLRYDGSEKVDVVFLCTPTDTHCDLIDVYKDKHLFVEKPLTNDRADSQRLHDMDFSKDKVSMVACNMRFEPLLEAVYDYLKLGKIGNLISVKFDFGYFLPYWRPDRDFKQIQHPGIVADCFHEFDLLLYLHGCPNKHYSIVKSGMFPGLGNYMPVSCDYIFDYASFSVNMHMDYFRREKRRAMEWIGDEGTLTYEENRSLRRPELNNRLLLNDMEIGIDEDDHSMPYLREIEYFFECIKEGRQSFNRIQSALTTTELMFGGMNNLKEY